MPFQTTQMHVEAVCDVDKTSKEKSALSRDGACDALRSGSLWRFLRVVESFCAALSTGFPVKTAETKSRGKKHHGRQRMKVTGFSPHLRVMLIDTTDFPEVEATSVEQQSPSRRNASLFLPETNASSFPLLFRLGLGAPCPSNRSFAGDSCGF